MRFALILVAILAVLTTVAGALLVRLVDPEAVRARVVAELQGAAGRPISVQGTAELSLLPRPMLSIGRVSIGRPASEPGGGGMMLEVDRVDLVLTPLPLLAGRTVIERVRLVRPQMFLEHSAEALELALAAMSAPESVLAGAEMVDGRLSVGAGRLLIEQLELAAARSPSGEITGDLRGRWGEREIRLDVTGRVSPTSRVAPLELGLQVDGGNHVAFTGSLQLGSGGLGVDGRISVSAAAIAAPARLALAIAGIEPPPDLDAIGTVVADGRIVGGSNSWRLGIESLIASGTELTGNLAVDRGNGQLTMLVEGPRLDLGRLPLRTLRHVASRLTQPAHLSGSIALRINEVVWGSGRVGDLRIEATLPGDGSLAIERATATLPGNTDFSMNGAFMPDGAPMLRAAATVSAPDLPAALSWLGVALPPVGPDRLRSLDATAKIEATQDQVAMRQLDGRIDSSRIRGSMAIGIASGRPQLAFDLDIDRLGLDGYLPDDDWRPLGAAFAWLAASTDIAGELDVGSLSWRAVRAQEIRLEGQIDSGRFTLRRLSSADLAEATVNVVGSGDLASGELSLALDAGIERPGRLLRLVGIDAPAVLSRFAPLRVDGTARSDGDAYAIELAAAAPGLTLDATTRLPRGLASRPERLQIDARAESVSDLLGRLGFPARTGPAYAGGATLAVDLGDAPGDGAAIDVDAKIGPSQLTGAVMIEGGLARPRLIGSGSIPALAPEHLGLALEIGELALGFPPGPPSRWPGAWPTRPLDWGWLDAADIELALDWPNADGRGNGKITLHDGTLDLLATDAPVVGGSASGTLRLGGEGPAPELDLSGQLEDVRSSDLLPLVSVRDGLSGRLDLDVTLASTGASIAELVGGLRGDGRLTLRDGRLPGLRFGPPRDQLLTPGTPFDMLTGWLAIDRGSVIGDGLSLTSPVADAALGFRLDLLAWVLEATARPRDPALSPVRVIGVPGRLRSVPQSAP